MILDPPENIAERVLRLSDAEILQESRRVSIVLWVLKSGRVHPSYPGVPRDLVTSTDVERWRGYDAALAVYYSMLAEEERARGLGGRVAPYRVPQFTRTFGWGDPGLPECGEHAQFPPWWREHFDSEVI